MLQIPLQIFTTDDFKVTFKKWMHEYFTEHPIQITSNKEPDFFNTVETATYLKVSKSTIHNWTLQGKLTAKKIGRKKLYSSEQITSALLNIDRMKYKR